MTLHTENAPSLSGNSAEGEDRNTNTHEGETINMKTTDSVSQGADNLRYIVIDTDVYDRETGMVAKFEHTGVAQIGADWLNGPDATPEDYEWVSAAADALEVSK